MRIGKFSMRIRKFSRKIALTI